MTEVISFRKNDYWLMFDVKIDYNITKSVIEMKSLLSVFCDHPSTREPWPALKIVIPKLYIGI